MSRQPTAEAAQSTGTNPPPAGPTHRVQPTGGALTAASLTALVKAGGKGRTADGACAGLYVQVSAPGRASWLFRYATPGGTRREMGLGPVAAPGARGGVSLAEARQAVEDARRLLRAGKDPVDTREAARADRMRAATPTPAAPTFRAVAEQHIAAHEKAWRNEKHSAQWGSTLERHAYPVLGEKPVDTITREDVLAVLTPIWQATPETAARVRQRVEAVLDAATARNLRTGENPARWSGGLEAILPARDRSRGGHQPALPWQQVPAFLMALDERSGIVPRCLRFAILTASRSNEVRGARWGEMDLDAGLWTVPAERMKGKVLHRVPLPGPALDMLRARHAAAGSPKAGDLIFPGERGAVLSDVSLSRVVKLMAVDGLSEGTPPRWRDEAGRAVVPHGFRASFKAWSRANGWADDLGERALAHTDKDKVRAAYHRNDMLDERRPMMEAWAAFATGRSAGVVVPLRRGDAA